MQQFMTGMYNYVTTFQPLVYLLVAIVLIIDGILFCIPHEKCKQIATSSIPFVVIGSGIILLATQLATEITSKFVF